MYARKREMTQMNELEKKLEEAKKIIQEWTDKQGHDRCWYYPDLFRRLATLFDINLETDTSLPPLEEFKKGCDKYQQEEYKIKQSAI